MLIHPRRFEEIKSAGQLPSPTGVAVAVLQLTRQEDSTLAEIGQVLQTDPALAGRLLKYANSAAFGGSRPVTALSEALIQLGLRRVRDLVLGFSLLSQYRGGGSRRFDYQGYWSQSLATAIATQMFCRHLKIKIGEEAFTCGLLSRVGKLGLATIHPETMDEVLAQADGRSDAELKQLERQYFAMDHICLTAAMLQDWGIPEQFILAVRCQDNPESQELPEEGPVRGLAGVLNLAHHVGRTCTVPVGEQSTRAVELFRQTRLLKLDRAAVIRLCDRVIAEWKEFATVFEVPAGEVRSFREIAEELFSPSEALDPEKQGRTILVAGGDQDRVQHLINELQAAGYRALSAGNGKSALRMMLDSNIRMLIADWKLPGMDGLELCRMLRQTDLGRGIHTIVLTEPGRDDQIVSACEAGADDCSPCNPRVLIARVGAGWRSIQTKLELEHEKEEVREYAARLAVVNRRLEETSFTDVLTGLPNRAYARTRLEQEWAAARRAGRRVSCMLVDIDRFKKVNDTYGHDVGDVVLQQTAEAMRKSLRVSDIVCRLGGEEFVVICQDTSLEGAVQVAERLRRTVEANHIRTPGFDGSVTISVGVATCTEEMSHPDELLKVADKLLYAAKHAGRNCIRAAGAMYEECAPVLVEA